MKVTLAKIISYVLNPLTVTVLAPFVLVYRTTYDINLAFAWTMYTVVFILFLGLFVYAGVRKKVFTDLDVSKREQRPLLFFVSLLFCASYLVSVILLRAPFILAIFAMSVIVGISFAYVINTKIKASMHVAVITAFTIPVAASFRNSYFLLLLLIPLVGWARLKTKRHTLPEVLMGGAVGGILSLSIYLGVKAFIEY
jgi:hypothetical protein